MPYRYLGRKSDTPYYHVYNRGNDKADIFLCADDYRRFLERLKLYAGESQVSVLAYCLMRNHYHLLLSEREPGGIARCMQRLNVAYAMYFNARYGRVGHLFQGPYKDKAVDTDSYLLQVSAYIHNNPVKIGCRAVDYPWSSYQFYVSGRSSWVDTEKVLANFVSASDKAEAYRSFTGSCQDLVLIEHARPGLGAVAR